MSQPPRTAPAVAIVLGLGLLSCTGSQKEAPRQAPPDPAQVSYAQGKYAAALPLLEKALTAGRSGTLLYQIGYCKGAIEGKDGDSKIRLWGEARPLLEGEIVEPGGATLDRLYYLTAICSEQGEIETMRKFARQAVDSIEKGPDPNALSGEDWFRLARIHEFLDEASEGEAAYRRAVSDFRKTPATNPSYQALALVRVADLDYDSRRFEAAASGYDEALKLIPNLEQVRPFNHGIALLATGRLEDAINAFGADRNEVTNTESQYAADLARKAKAAGGLVKADADGAPIDSMPLEGLDGRIKQAGADFRAAREKHSFRAGDSLPAEVADRQRRFVSLLRERLLQTGEVQEFCLKEGLADLVRR